VLTDFFPNFRR